jgi:hypothetical protein
MKLSAPALGVMSLVLAAGAVMVASTDAHAQLRVGSWNISNYGGGRTSDIQTAFYGVYSGRQFAPDILTVQEVLSAAALAEMVTILNTAPGSPGDWAAATYVNGADTESVFLYRTSKVTFVQQKTIAVGSSDTNNQPRNTYRYDIRPVGYSAVPAASLALYSVHLKAGSASSDNARRLVEPVGVCGTDWEPGQQHGPLLRPHQHARLMEREQRVPVCAHPGPDGFGRHGRSPRPDPALRVAC